MSNGIWFISYDWFTQKKPGIDELGFPFIIDESSELIKTDNCVEKDCISKSKVYKFKIINI